MIQLNLQIDVSAKIFFVGALLQIVVHLSSRIALFQYDHLIQHYRMMVQNLIITFCKGITKDRKAKPIICAFALCPFGQCDANLVLLGLFERTTCVP